MPELSILGIGPLGALGRALQESCERAYSAQAFSINAMPPRWISTTSALLLREKLRVLDARV